ncbi:hypothetical protein MYCFIDRAFT_78722 [Lecanosticta acicola]|uniref:non-specific serine/threonine protein kinase n=1 Tax=Lecanosticta acicola TaxID=111012 RepID=A0AAI9EG21_9PEZI|nr:hypothetical protein MYCFIDRAFT_78722 [Lecanosticta acicola]
MPHHLRNGRQPTYGAFFEHFDDFPEPAGHVPDVSVGTPLASSQVSPPALPPRNNQRQSSAEGVATVRSTRPAASSFYTVTTDKDPKRFPARPESFAKEYEVIRKLNWTNGNALFLVRDRVDGKLFIIKQVHGKLRSGKFPISPHETNMLDALREHPGMLTMVDHFCDTDVPGRPLHNIVCEFADVGDIANLTMYSKSRGQRIPESFVLHFTASMINALAFMHYGVTSYTSWNGRRRRATTHRPVVHRDLKLHNVFLKWNPTAKTEGGLPDVVIGDLGLASYDDHTNKGAVGTNIYMPPEVLSYIDAEVKYPHLKGTAGICSKAGDMWGFGMILYELLALQRYEPDLGNTIQAVFDASTVSKHKEILELLERCLAKQPQLRPRADKLQKYATRFNKRVKSWHRNGNRLTEDFWPEAAYMDQVMNAGDRKHTMLPGSDMFSLRRHPGRTGVPRRLRNLSDGQRFSSLMQSLEGQFADFSGHWARERPAEE